MVRSVSQQLPRPGHVEEGLVQGDPLHQRGHRGRRCRAASLLSSMYRWNRPSTKTADGQSRRATDEGMAEWTPNMRAS